MKRLIFIPIILLFLTGCHSTINRQLQQENKFLKETNFVLENNYKTLSHQFDSLKTAKVDTIIIERVDTVSVETEEGLLAMYKIERVKYYISITESRPANKQFFYGWVRRAVAD